MNTNSNKSLSKALSLMDRMDETMTHSEALLNESMYAMLAESKRIPSNSLIEFMTKYEINKGPFVQLGYIQLYPTSKIYPNDKIYDEMSDMRSGFEDGSRGLGRFDQFMDKVSNSEWNSPTGRAYNGARSMAQNVYSYILKLTTYRIHWQDEGSYKKNLSNKLNNIKNSTEGWSDELKNAMHIRDTESDPNTPRYRHIGELGKYNIATFSKPNDDGEYEPLGQEYYNSIDNPDDKVTYDRTAIQNILSDVRPQEPLYFGIYTDGTIDPIPKPLGKLLYSKSDSFDKYLNAIEDPNDKAKAMEYVKLMRDFNMSVKTFLTQNVAYLCGKASAIGSDGGESVYWVNPNPLFLLEKAKTKDRPAFKYIFNNISNDELQSILGRFAKQEADELDAIANPNIQGEVSYSTL